MKHPFSFVALSGVLFLSVLHAEKAPPCPDARAAEELRKGTIGLLVVGKDSCSGTLIAPRAVLTTAQCVVNRSADEVRFTLHEGGMVRRASFAKAKEIYLHPRFPAKLRGGAPPAADVAIVALADTNYGDMPPVFYDVFSEPEAARPGVAAFVIGYGLNPDGSRTGRRSRKVKFVAPKSAPLSDSEEVPDGFFRLNRGDDGELPCTGDSGGPLLRFNGHETRIWGLHAVSALSNLRDARGVWLPMSAAERCRRSDEALATSIAPYAKWIDALRVEVGGKILCHR